MQVCDALFRGIGKVTGVLYNVCMDTTKYCSQCKNHLGLGLFYKDKGKRLGVSTYCKECTKERSRRNRLADVDEYNRRQRERTRAIVARNRESGFTVAEKRCPMCDKTKPSDDFWRNVASADGLGVYCKECERERTRRKLKENPDYYKEKYYRRREKALKHAKKARKKDPEKFRERCRRWKKLNKDRVIAYAARRRKIISKSREHFTAKDIRRLRKKQRGKCVYCRIKLNKNIEQVDHIIPLSKGGDNSRFNIQLLCRDCNLSKNAKMPHEWAQEIGLLI